ncbi:MAG: hypothetical protein ACKOXB_13195 [Flavobacteriales bacterium]
MKQFFFAFILLLLSTKAFSQGDTTQSKITLGLEQDMLPYLLHGFIGTVWVGTNHWRLRASYAEANIPAFVIQEGLSEDRTHAFGLSAEYFLKDNFKGLWFGPGIGYWNNHVTTADNNQGNVKSWVFSLGGGYNIFLWKSLYTTPWLALHTRLLGTDARNIGTVEYKPMLFTPEASLKLGWRF